MSRKSTRRERAAGRIRHEPPPPVNRPIVRPELAQREMAEAAEREAERQRQRDAMTPAQRDAERARGRVGALLAASLMISAGMGLGWERR